MFMRSISNKSTFSCSLFLLGLMVFFRIYRLMLSNILALCNRILTQLLYHHDHGY